MERVMRLGAIITLIALVVGAPKPARAQTNPEWTAGFGVPGNGMNDAVTAFALFDDGGGRDLYASGWYTDAGGVSANHIAKWNALSWSALGSGTVGRHVSALAVYDDGHGPALYAGGEFSSAGGVAANYIAKWDGKSWSALVGPGGNGTNGRVYSLAAFNDGHGSALFVGGEFDYAGGVYASRIAKWNGTNWSAVGPGMGGNQTSVYALLVLDLGSGPALYAGGFFHVVGNFVAKWNGSTWSPVGVGMDSTVYALAGFNDGSGPALYAGGYFDHAGGTAVYRIAKWNGTSWSALGSGMGGIGSPFVYALQVYDDGSGPALYAGGDFTLAGGVPANSLAKWNGSTWAALGSGLGGDFPYVYTLKVFSDRGGPGLYVGGTFTTAGGLPSACIARWGHPWYPTGDVNCDGAVNFGDIDPFVLALTGQAAYQNQYPNCNWVNADCNGDGSVDFADIDPFVALLSGG